LLRSSSSPDVKDGVALCWITRLLLEHVRSPRGHPLPTILVGGANGKHRGGQHIDPGQPTPLANVHLSILDKAGVERKSFGDSTGMIGV
jgi:hypothetical protein